MTNPSETHELPTTPTTPSTPTTPIDDELDRTYHAITQLIQTTLNSPPPTTPRLSIEFQPDHLQLCLTPNHEQQHHSIIISIDHTTTSSSPSSPSPSPSSSPSSSSPSTQQHHQHQQNQQQQQLCLTPTSHTSFDFKTIRPNRTIDHYCCFAIPLYNTGIYSILAQFTIFGFVFGILSFSAPSILAIVLDFSFTAFFGVLCLAVGSIQALGFYGVYKEKPIIFKRYFMGNVGLIGITFLYSLILLIISSTKHQTAIDQCLLQFVSNDEFVDGPSNSSRQLCSVWTWAQLAVCFFVWFLFFFSQLYFCYMVKVWGQDQRLDHIRYQSLISAVRQSRATSSMVQPSHLEGGDEWESRSTGGSLDIRSSTYSGHSNRRAKGGVANGGSRLKNEIEWKEIPHSTNEPVSPPPAHQQVSSDSSESSESARRKQKYRQRTARLDDEDEDPIDPHLTLASTAIGSRSSISLFRIPLLPPTPNFLQIIRSFPG
ncbi:uncharacterized protein PGTG_21946 [Puccinia graminis f. sp. tritici CRL 75-36-700-3]|uniref:Uncharacterized protein n=1 Tax=Puccinia graminis f. sp. tritici (strain CRL 75-36-700-3 / race SCCL) TaxID=418459 RepID=H6QSX5_PUCGT|nr:uncharacterized protein PGTG_21946 [Puccinia graminis f. sp. tritici CRL 75-36-700-3]EHS63928.1 hypothetical protein PGTG_21946 [Puccinia graminis f. sp. tritici CRL 75-36-700-3]